MIETSESVASYLDQISLTDLQNTAAVRAGGFAMKELLVGNPAANQLDVIESLDGGSLERLQELYGQFEVDLENEFAAKIIAGEAGARDYPSYEGFAELVEAESKLAEVIAGEKILFIGSGPLPMSAILFSLVNRSPVRCFDISETACETSRQVLKSLGIDDRLEIINGSGEDQPLDEYDIIVVAVMAQPKSRIMENIAVNASSKTRVIVRDTDSAMQVFYKGFESVDSILINQDNLVRTAKRSAQGKNKVSSILLRLDGQLSPVTM